MVGPERGTWDSAKSETCHKKKNQIQHPEEIGLEKTAFDCSVFLISPKSIGFRGNKVEIESEKIMIFLTSVTTCFSTLPYPLKAQKIYEEYAEY